MATVSGTFCFEFDSHIRGYHVYRDVWTPAISEVLPRSRETTNGHDPFAVMVTKSGAVVGHLPRKISSICSSFLRKGGSLSSKVTGSHQYSSDLIQGGMEIPCIQTGNETLIEKVKKLLLLCEKLSTKSSSKKIKVDHNASDPVEAEVSTNTVNVIIGYFPVLAELG